MIDRRSPSSLVAKLRLWPLSLNPWSVGGCCTCSAVLGVMGSRKERGHLLCFKEHLALKKDNVKNSWRKAWSPTVPEPEHYLVMLELEMINWQ